MGQTFDAMRHRVVARVKYQDERADPHTGPDQHCRMQHCRRQSEDFGLVLYGATHTNWADQALGNERHRSHSSRSAVFFLGFLFVFFYISYHHASENDSDYTSLSSRARRARIIGQQIIRTSKTPRYSSQQRVAISDHLWEDELRQR